MSRQKHKFSTLGEVAHTWAHDWRSRGHGSNSSGSLYFQQETIFSYGSHFPIARFDRDASGNDIVLFTVDDYSNSTSRHIRTVQSAISHHSVYYVPNLSPKSNRDHLENWTHLRSNLNEARNRLCAARNPSAYDLQFCDTQAKKCNDYAEAFDVRGLESHQLPIVAYTDSQRSEWMTKIDAKAAQAELNRIEAEARRERETVKRIEAETIRDAAQSRLELFERITFGLYKAPRPVWKYGHKSIGRGPRSVDDTAKIARQVSEWKRSEPGSRFPYGYSGPVVMRLDTDRENCRTSQNAVFPASDCVSIWPAIKLANETATRNDEPSAKLGMYRVDHIAANGDIKAGCHLVSFAECRKLAIMLEIEKPTMAERIAHKARKLIK